MNLYLLTRKNENSWTWDDYIGAVVVAENEKEAIRIHPNGNSKFPWRYNLDGWVFLKDIEVTYLGAADKTLNKNIVVLSNFIRG